MIKYSQELINSVKSKDWLFMPVKNVGSSIWKDKASNKKILVRRGLYER